MAGIYVHIPFCERKCRYCDFYSITDESLIPDYSGLIIKEIAIAASDHPKFAADSVFIGGGTPSMLPAESIAAIIDSLRSNFEINTKSEISIETNPGTLTPQQLEAYQRTGINRLSVGVQSFADQELAFLGRIHDSRQAIKSINKIKNSGFTNFNLDLIFGIPGQSIDSWNRTLDTAIEFGAPHISAYGLIYEPGTPLTRDLEAARFEPADEDIEAQLYHLLVEKLAAAGLWQYEVSNFAKPGLECRHNLNYWSGGDYLAFGPAAHGYTRGERYWNYPNLHEYAEAVRSGRAPVAGSEIPSENDRLIEYVMLNIRQGRLDIERLARELPTESAQELDPIINALQKEGKIFIEDYMIRLTTDGYLVSDEIAIRILDKISINTNS
ncbi:MAG: radical SAM family heme chaperone HemW [Bacteroidota bacterium]